MIKSIVYLEVNHSYCIRIISEMIQLFKDMLRLKVFLEFHAQQLVFYVFKIYPID